MSPADEELVSVLETLDETQVTVVSSMLEQAEIPFLVRGLGGAGLDTLVNRVASVLSRRTVGIHVVVPLSYEDRARELLEPADGEFEDVPELRAADPSNEV